MYATVSMAIYLIVIICDVTPVFYGQINEFGINGNEKYLYYFYTDGN